MKNTTKFKDLPLEAQNRLKAILDRNRYKPKTRTKKVKTNFTKTELETNFRNYLLYN